MNLRALLELMRVSNLPTVWSNAWVGAIAGIVAASHDHRGSDYGVFFEALLATDELLTYVLLFAAAGPMAVMSMIYIGGMIMNDLVDREVDQVERPGRPIPSGRVSVQTARILVIGLFGLAYVNIFLLGPTFNSFPTFSVLFGTSILIAMVVLYNLQHSANTWSVAVMASCRALIILVCATYALNYFLVVSSWVAAIVIWGPAFTVFLYTLAISIVARREVAPERGGFGGPKTIMNMIAAMPLLDALWLVAMGLWPASLVCVACAGLTKLGHRRIAGS